MSVLWWKNTLQFVVGLVVIQFMLIVVGVVVVLVVIYIYVNNYKHDYNPNYK